MSKNRDILLLKPFSSQQIVLKIRDPEYQQDLFQNFKLFYISQPGDFMLSTLRHPGLTFYPIIDTLTPEESENGTLMGNIYTLITVKERTRLSGANGMECQENGGDGLYGCVQDGLRREAGCALPWDDGQETLFIIGKMSKRISFRCDSR